jgi:alkanesulfonate monooxygenase SsuD/methylene tetrahydromethanopterin reductase-like flavin-dependent oxidoreductase (luciferase family)
MGLPSRNGPVQSFRLPDFIVLVRRCDGIVPHSEHLGLMSDIGSVRNRRRHCNRLTDSGDARTVRCIVRLPLRRRQPRWRAERKGVTDAVQVILMQEGHRPEGVSIHQRWLEMVHEAVLAEEVGFDLYGQGEQHFARFNSNVSTPEVNHAYIASRTSRIRFRPMSSNLLPFNHPIRIVEQLNALDLLSGGRAELGVARSNNPYTLEGFGIKASNTKQYRDEALAVIGKAVSQESFEHHGEFYDIPERSVAPKPLQRPHPPIHMSATSIASHEDAGRMGIGVMCGNTSAGWEYAQECIDLYKATIKDAEPVTGHVNNNLAIVTTAVNCHPSADRAKEGARRVAAQWFEAIMHTYTTLAKQSRDYAYLGRIELLKERMYDLDYLIESSPYVTIGTPEFFIERAHLLHRMGVDQWLLRLDGMGHEENMRAIKLIGREVLPEVHKLTPHEGSTQWSAPVGAETARDG